MRIIPILEGPKKGRCEHVQPAVADSTVSAALRLFSFNHPTTQLSSSRTTLFLHFLFDCFALLLQVPLPCFPLSLPP